jgi:DNA (cytosine-5)-methyltransferase 1
MKKIAAIDLFCGAGGLTRGLLDAGIDVICGIDADEKCSLTYESNNIRKNGEPVKYIRRNIKDISGDYINQLFSGSDADYFMLAGCAPCQPFSRKNIKKKNDGRVNLLSEFGRLIKETEPDFIFMENVPEIEKIHKKTLHNFKSILKKMDYFSKAKVVNAKDYGIPQNRKRYILLGSRPWEIDIIEPVCNLNTGYVTVRDAIGNAEKLPPIKAGESHSLILNHKAMGLSDLNLKRIRYTPADGGGRKDWPYELVLECHKKTSGHSDSYGRMKWDNPAPTLTTKFYSISNGRYGHPEQNRAISLKEGALIQSFHYSYIFYGNMQEIARQIGNAVPPKLAKEINTAFIR